MKPQNLNINIKTGGWVLNHRLYKPTIQIPDRSRPVWGGKVELLIKVIYDYNKDTFSI